MIIFELSVVGRNISLFWSSGDSGVWGLKKNFALLELLERLQNGATNQSGMSEDALREMGEVRKMRF